MLGKCVVIGAAGQLGSELRRHLSVHHTVALTRTDIELSQPDTFLSILRPHAPAIIFNCAAMNHVDAAESDPTLAFAINALAPRALAQAARCLGATLVHFSTDYVFGHDAARQHPYCEFDAPGPVNAYGMSKLAGEMFVRMACDQHFVFRTCGLYGQGGFGGKGRNFVDTIRRKVQSGEAPRVVNDQWCSPTWTRDLAQWTVALVATRQYGLYHLVNAGGVTWHGLAREIVEHLGGGVSLTSLASRDLNLEARRPTYSVLACDKYDALGLPPRRAIGEALREYLATSG